MRLNPCRRILAPKDKRKIVYAITVLEAFRLETDSKWLAMLTVWLTGPPQSSQIRSCPRRTAIGFSWLLGVNRTILIQSWDGTRFIPQDPALQPFPVAFSSSVGFSGCGKTSLLCHSERSEDTLFDLTP